MRRVRHVVAPPANRAARGTAAFLIGSVKDELLCNVGFIGVLGFDVPEVF